MRPLIDRSRRRFRPAALLVALALVLPAACGGGDEGVAPAATASASVDPNAVVIGHAGSLNAFGAETSWPRRWPRRDHHPQRSRRLAGGGAEDQGRHADRPVRHRRREHQRRADGAPNGNKVRWFATFASNAVVVAYSPLSPLLKDFEKAKAGKGTWYAPLEKKGVRVTRSDPDSDPGGLLHGDGRSARRVGRQGQGPEAAPAGRRPQSGPGEAGPPPTH